MVRPLADAEDVGLRTAAAAALWDIGGEPEAAVVVQSLLGAWEHNDATANHVSTCLNRMGPAAAPALPRIQTELQQPRHGGHFKNITTDEELQRTCHAILQRLT